MEARKQYTKEFKLDAISLVLDQGFTIAEAARSLGIRANMLGRWIKENQADNNGQAFRGNGKLTPEQEEIRRLKIENKQLKLERQILKEAAGDSTGHCNTAEIFCDGDKKFNVFLGRSFNSSAIISSCSCE